MDEIVDKLKELGLNSYEAKVYLALLKKSPATGYETAKLANIPQSRAYDTLKALETQQIVTSSCAKPQTFVPIKPKELTKRHKRRFDATLSFLEKKLPSVKERPVEPVGTFRDTAKILETAAALIKNAKKVILFAMNEDNYKAMDALLREAYSRGVDVKGEFSETHFLALSADDEVLYAKGSHNAIRTKNEDVAFLTKHAIVNVIKQKARS